VNETDIAVIGAGPAGLGAALAAGRAGARITLIDERPAAASALASSLPASPWERRRRELAHELAATRVEYLADTLAWGLCPRPDGRWRLALAQGERYLERQARAVVLATGSTDRWLPFPGWASAAVVGLRDALRASRLDPVIADGPVLLAGSDPDLLLAADALITAGLTVAGVVLSVRELPAVAAASPIGASDVGQVAEAAARLGRADVPILLGWAVVSVAGNPGRCEARVAPLGADGRPVDDGAMQVPTGSVVMSYGGRPEAELARLAGAGFELDAGSGDWYPVLEPGLATTVPSVWVAGDLARGYGVADTGMAGIAPAPLPDGAIADGVVPIATTPAPPSAQPLPWYTRNPAAEEAELIEWANRRFGAPR